MLRTILRFRVVHFRAAMGALVLWVCAAGAAGAHAPSLSQDAPVAAEMSLPRARVALQQALTTLGRARRQQDTARMAQAHLAAGSACHVLRQYETALYHFRRTIALTRTNTPPGLLASTEALRLLGHTLYMQGDTGQARQVYQRALHRYQQQRSLPGQGRVHMQLGSLYGSENKWRQALKCHEQALLAWQLAHDSAQIGVSLRNIGVAHQHQHQYSRALYYLRQSLALGKQRQDSSCVSETLGSIGQVYQEFGNREVALNYYAQALSSLPYGAPASSRATTLLTLGSQHDSLEHYGLAQFYLNTALEPARQTGSFVLLAQVYQALAEAYRHNRQPAEALRALRAYTSLQDSAFAERRAAQISELQTRYETEKKEREIQLLTKDQQLQQANLRRETLLRNLLGVGALLLLLLVAVLFRGRRQQAHTNRVLERKNAAINHQKEELDRLNQTKDTLFSVISHDLRSPLSSLYSLLSLLNLGTLPPARLAAHSERITRTLDSTLRLLDNLLNWSATQMQGAGGARPERLRLDVLAEEALSLLLGDAERKNILLLNEIQKPYLARADLNMTRLVLRNLLGNAVKFTAPGGTVTVSARLVGRMWEVTVRDTGVGISAADKDKLFGQQGPHTTPGTANEKGTGLGLRLCKEFVERNGGLLSFDSKPGHGTAFSFTLPAADALTPSLPLRVARDEEEPYPENPGASAAAG